MGLDDFDIGQQIGRGGFATVYGARNRYTGKEVAIKIIEKCNITTSEMMKRVINEIRIHKMLDHNSIVHLIDHFEDDDAFYLIMDLCRQGNLYKYLRTHGPLPEDVVANYCDQILDALKYLQEKSVIHRDMKLSNILVDSQYTIKLCDFGLATQLEHPDEEHFTMCGTPNYIAPEIASQKSHGFPADLWALGCLCFSMLTGTPPFEHGGGVKETLENIVAGEYSIPRNVNMSSEAQDFIRCLLHVDPRSRASADQMKRHSFIVHHRQCLPPPPPVPASSPTHSSRHRNSTERYDTDKTSKSLEVLRFSFDGGGGVNSSTATTALPTYDSKTGAIDDGSSIGTNTRDGDNKISGYSTGFSGGTNSPLTPFSRPLPGNASSTHRYDTALGSSRGPTSSSVPTTPRPKVSRERREQYSGDSGMSSSASTSASHRSPGALVSQRESRPNSSLLRRSYDGSATSVTYSRKQDCSGNHTEGGRFSRHSYDGLDGARRQQGPQTLPRNWRDSLQCLRQNLSVCSGSGYGYGSAASTRHSSASIAEERHRSNRSVNHSASQSVDRSEDNMSWSLESSSYRRQVSSTADNSLVSMISAVSGQGQSLSIPNDGRSSKDIPGSDSGYSRLWVPRLTPSQKKTMMTTLSPNSTHRKAFSYSSPRGDVLVLSTAGDVVFCTYLKDKAGRFRPCRLLVRARDPLKLHIGKVDKAMCQEILNIRDEGEPLAGDYSSRSSSNDKEQQSLTIFSDTLMMRKYHVASLPTFLSLTYKKVSRMLSLARKKMPKLILYITKPPIADRTYHYLRDQEVSRTTRDNSRQPNTTSSANTKSSTAASSASNTVNQGDGEVLCKCMLMSNTPLPDFYMRWVDGTRLSYSLELSQLHLSHSTDKSKAYRWDGDRTGDSDWTDSAPKEVRRYLAEAQVAMRKCLAQEGREAGVRGWGTTFPLGGAPQILVDSIDAVDTLTGKSYQ